MRRLSVCAVFRDERLNLAEWVAFHLLMGVEHFYLYDNLSEDRPGEVLEPFIRRGCVSLQEWPVPYALDGQAEAYRDCLRRANGTDRWVAFIDLDEFLFSPSGRSLPDCLETYADAAGVAVNWQGYGSGGQVERTEGLTIERFLHRAPTSWARNRRTKCIVDPRRVEGPLGPHLFTPAGAAQLVDETGHPVTVRRVHPTIRRLRAALVRFLVRAPVDPYAVNEPVGRSVSVNRLRINHYAVKSRAEYRQKQRRHSPAASTDGPPPRYREEFFRYHDRNDVFDPVLRPYAEEVRRLLADVCGMAGTGDGG